MQVLGDFPDQNNQYTCDDEDTLAQLRYEESGSPTLVICDIAFKHGGIGKGYGILPRVRAVECSNFANPAQVSWRMDTLGALILHEYTHYRLLVAPPLAKETTDEEYGYGSYNTRQLPKSLALYNADSYSWMATENLWNEICQVDYAAPDRSSDNDPKCGLRACHH